MYCYHKWVPSQCGIMGNKLVYYYQLAKQGAAEHQTENQVTVHKQKTLIKAIRKQRPFLLLVRRHYTWSTLEMKSVVFCSASTGPCSFSCNGAGIGQISSLSNQ